MSESEKDQMSVRERFKNERESEKEIERENEKRQILTQSE